MEEFKNFWNSLGWLANAVQIFGLFFVGLTIFTSVKKYFINSVSHKKYKNVHDYIETQITDSSYVLSKIKSTSKVAIVDDNSDDFPVDYLRRAGLNVEIYNEVSLTDAEKLARYDVVLLDIVGVVREDKKEGGLELIKRIKSHKQHADIIAVSGKKFDPKSTEFFKLADDVMKKPIAEKSCEDVIIKILENRISPLKASSDIDAHISCAKLTAREYTDVNLLLINYLRGKIDVDSLRRRLSKQYGINDFPNVIAWLDKIKIWLKG